MVETLPLLESCGDVTLGLNGNEANILARLLGPPPAQEAENTMRLAADLRSKIGVSTVLIHKMKFAVSAGPSGTFSTQGPFCEVPVKSTGAGDRFNAGYCLGLLADGSPEDCLTLGSAVSGFFVRNARSPSRTEVVKLLHQWAEGHL
jgi:sugar/nucleoside kinase (ribokinase family)